MQTLNDLNTKYAIAESVTFSSGKGGLSKAVLRHESGAQLEAYPYGAHITSWQSREFTEVFFVSDKADFIEGKAIRGGIPLVFPQFGKGSLPSHGFARNSYWQVESTTLGKDGEVKLTFAFTNNEKTFALWPFKFKLEFEIKLAKELTTVLRVYNLDDKTFSFQNALHSYFQIGDISRIAVKNLGGLSYLNNLKNREVAKEDRELVIFESEVDRIYQNAPELIEITDSNLNRKILIEKHNFSDAVLWNPAVSGSKPIADLQENDYIKFVCVEAANFPSMQLAPGNVAESSQKITVEKS